MHLEALKKLIESDGFFAIFGSDVSWDDPLDARDQADFDERWVQHHEALLRFALDDESSLQIRQVRERVFEKIFLASGNAELASCVSDDFGLIANHVVLQLPESWVDKLLSAYQRGEFPHAL
ncbi:hypothetical protein [Pseudomonas viridiflava]|uniref:hypothetical protein n=1 Tax=Pseudomonas viridiflava TaxID=33069 RepID=UPI000F017550|nr:hypothetical protein [Pseudomonas viridiflava]